MSSRPKRAHRQQYALPASIAPFQCVVTITNVREAELLAAGERVAAALDAAGVDTLLDDRDERAGVKFKDAELIGVPYRINIGKKLSEGLVELVDRLTHTTTDLPIDSRRRPRSHPHHAQALGPLFSLRSTLYALPTALMPVKVKIGRKNRSFLWRVGRFFALVCLAGLVLFAIVFGIAFHHYQGVVDDRLKDGPLFAQVAQIYAAPQEIRPGQQLTAASIAASLRRAGYNGNPQLGNYQLRGDTILVKPGPQSYHSTDGATITTTDGQVQSITAENGVALKSYQLEPQLITALSEDKNRTKRRLVTYKDIPPNMVQAVVAIEDHSFFSHSGVNYPRLIKCAFTDILARPHETAAAPRSPSSSRAASSSRPPAPRSASWKKS